MLGEEKDYREGETYFGGRGRFQDLFGALGWGWGQGIWVFVAQAGPMIFLPQPPECPHT